MKRMPRTALPWPAGCLGIIRIGFFKLQNPLARQIFYATPACVPGSNLWGSVCRYGGNHGEVPTVFGEGVPCFRNWSIMVR